MRHRGTTSVRPRPSRSLTTGRSAGDDALHERHGSDSTSTPNSQNINPWASLSLIGQESKGAVDNKGTGNPLLRHSMPRNLLETQPGEVSLENRWKENDGDWDRAVAASKTSAVTDEAPRMKQKEAEAYDLQVAQTASLSPTPTSIEVKSAYPIPGTYNASLWLEDKNYGTGTRNSMSNGLFISAFITA